VHLGKLLIFWIPSDFYRCHLKAPKKTLKNEEIGQGKQELL
jgi:hypothetical protein